MRFPVDVTVGSELSQLAAIDGGFQDILLNVEIVVDDPGEGLAESREIFDCFVEAVIVDVIACRFGTEGEVIADILLDKAICVMAADHRIG